MAKETKATAAEKAVTKLGKQRDLRKAIGDARDGIRDARRGPGSVRDLDNGVH